MRGLICLGLGHDPRMYPDSPQFASDGPDLPLRYREQPERILGTATDESNETELFLCLFEILAS
jgi:hypothetical protein